MTQYTQHIIITIIKQIQTCSLTFIHTPWLVQVYGNCITFQRIIFKVSFSLLC